MNQFRYGVCYFPEHWPLKNIASDLSRIADSGFDYIRIGEGAWWYFEPKEGQYQFELFDRVVAEAAKRKISIIFGTPTYCGPAWISHKYPEVLRWDYNRVPMKHGSRRFYNYTSPRYLELCDGVVSALADHYKSEKSIWAWQVDNEFNCHMSTSYAPTDTIAFRAWLKKKYRTLEALNDAWGTRFWSQVYSDWEEIDLPHPTATFHNPTLLLDEKRFISDTVVTFFNRQKKILLRANPNWQVTHNAIFQYVRPRQLGRELSFFSHDQYPLFFPDWWSAANGLIQSRGISFPYAVLEQQAGPGGQMYGLPPTPVPGQMRLWAMQSIAHGASTLSYFCWRTCPFGTEQHWHGLVDQDNKMGRRVREAKGLGIEMKSLPREVWTAPVSRAAALLRDDDNEVNEQNINTYVPAGGELWRWQGELLKRHIPVDQIWLDSDWDGYNVIVAPHLRIVDEKLIARLTKFVRSGGTLVLGAQSGIKDRNLHMREQTAPGPLAKLAGVEVEEWSVVNDKDSRTFAIGNQEIKAVGFVERLKLSTASAVAHWQNHDPLLESAPAIGHNKVGRGQVIYIGAYLPAESIGAVLGFIGKQADIKPTIAGPESVEAVLRQGKAVDYLWLLNHADRAVTLSDLPKAKNLLEQGELVEDDLSLPPYGATVLEMKKPRKS